MVKTHVFNAKDKLTTKIFAGYCDGSSEVNYVRQNKIHDTVETLYCNKMVVYLYSQDRPFRKNNRIVYSDRTESKIKELETEAERYIRGLQTQLIIKGRHLTNELKEAKAAFDLILIFRKWTGWKPMNSLSIKNYYKRGEYEEWESKYLL